MRNLRQTNSWRSSCSACSCRTSSCARSTRLCSREPAWAATVLSSTWAGRPGVRAAGAGQELSSGTGRAWWEASGGGRGSECPAVELRQAGAASPQAPGALPAPTPRAQASQPSSHARRAQGPVAAELTPGRCVQREAEGSFTHKGLLPGPGARAAFVLCLQANPALCWAWGQVCLDTRGWGHMTAWVPHAHTWTLGRGSGHTSAHVHTHSQGHPLTSRSEHTYTHTHPGMVTSGQHRQTRPCLCSH